MPANNFGSTKRNRAWLRIMLSVFLFLIILTFHIESDAQGARRTRTLPKASQQVAASGSSATPGANSVASALVPEVLGAKALLEDLLVRRYTQDLATRVDRQSFTLGSFLELTEIPEEKKEEVVNQEAEPLSDLMLGSLDPEELIRKYSPEDVKPAIQGFLTHFRVKSAVFSVGLKEDLDPTVKQEVTKWLTARVKAEFGGVGKGSVYPLKVPVERKPPPKTLLEWLGDFQSLAGQLVIALAFLIGIILWRILGGGAKASPQQNEAQTINVNTKGAGGDEAEAIRRQENKILLERQAQEKDKAESEIRELNFKILELAQKLTREFDTIFRSWCQAGDSGRLKVACFAESVGRDLGRLPIPVDALPDVKRAFYKLPELGAVEKKAIVQKIYYDLLSVLNLGADSLAQPFGYLGGMNVGNLNQVLMDQNTKMKTLVSLYLPNEVRSKFIQAQSLEDKLALLESASSLAEVEALELKGLEARLASKLKPQDNKDVVPLEMGFSKVVSGLSIVEQLRLLGKVTGAGVQEYRRTVPSIAFLSEWPDEKLTLLLAHAGSDELGAYLRICQDQAERFLRLAPSLTAEVVKDELTGVDKLSDREKEVYLESLLKRVTEMVEAKEVDLEEVFPLTDAKPVQRVSAA